MNWDKQFPGVTVSEGQPASGPTETVYIINGRGAGRRGINNSQQLRRVLHSYAQLVGVRAAPSARHGASWVGHFPRPKCAGRDADRWRGVSAVP